MISMSPVHKRILSFFPLCLHRAALYHDVSQVIHADNAPHMGARRALYISLSALPGVMQDTYGVCLTRFLSPALFHC